MNVRNLIAAGTLVLSAAIAVPATASISTGNLGTDVQSALGSGGNVNVTVQDGVATLRGNVDTALTKLKVRQAALANADVDRVVDLVVY